MSAILVFCHRSTSRDRDVSVVSLFNILIGRKRALLQEEEKHISATYSDRWMMDLYATAAAS